MEEPRPFSPRRFTARIEDPNGGMGSSRREEPNDPIKSDFRQRLRGRRSLGDRLPLSNSLRDLCLSLYGFQMVQASIREATSYDMETKLMTWHGDMEQNL
jgi:hypothetical protein